MHTASSLLMKPYGD